MKNITILESVVKMPLMGLPVNTPVVKLKTGIVMISPGSQLKDLDYQKVSGVTDLVAPNLLHSAGIPHAHKSFPQAKVWGVKGLEKLKKDIHWDHVLSPEAWPYQEELPIFHLGGMPNVREVVFYHRESKTLIVTDLFFNMVNVKGVGAWIILNIFGTYGKFAVSRLLAKYIKDQKEFENSLSEILRLDIENIIVSHGENVVGNAKMKLAGALNERGFHLK